MSERTQSQSEFSDSDQRYLARWETSNDVTYRVENIRKVYEGQLKDLSCSGACVYVKEPLVSNQNIDITLYLDKDTSIDLEGVIVWVESLKGEYKVGVKFKETSFKAQELILGHAFELDPKKLADHWFRGWSDTV